jgi:phosphate transport system substrate-binding protein
MKHQWLLLFGLFILLSCNNSGSKETSTEGKSTQSVSITAAGATFPLPFYNLSFKNYTKETGVQLSYGGIGSGGGIRSLKDRVVDFGATDAFLDDSKATDMPAEIVHVPTCIGAVVIAFNLPGIENVRLSNKNLEEIFMGKITNWNDAKLKVSNPTANLPDLAVTVVSRSDGSGTTHIFSDYMSKISSVWEKEVGTGKSLKWPVGISAKGNPGVAGTIKGTKGSIGYIGSEFAFSQNIFFAEIENKTGNYIRPNLASISAAAKGDIPADTRIMLNNSDDPAAYPISGFTWLILYKEQNYNGRSLVQAEETLKFLSWIIDQKAQNLAEQVNYASLPEKAVAVSKEILKTVTYDGKLILK